MIDITKLQQRIRAEHQIGARVTEEIKTALDRFCKDKDIKVAVLITALVEDILKANSYLD